MADIAYLHNVPVQDTSRKIRAYRELYGVNNVEVYVYCTGVEKFGRGEITFSTKSPHQDVVSYLWKMENIPTSGTTQWFHLSKDDKTSIVKPQDLTWEEMRIIARQYNASPASDRKETS